MNKHKNYGNVYIVKYNNESDESLIKRFRKAVKKAQIIAECKYRMEFIPKRLRRKFKKRYFKK